MVDERLFALARERASVAQINIAYKAVQALHNNCHLHKNWAFCTNKPGRGGRRLEVPPTGVENLRSHLRLQKGIGASPKGRIYHSPRVVF